MQQGYWVSFSWIVVDDKYGFGIVDVVVVVGYGVVVLCVCYIGNCCGVIDMGLVVYVVCVLVGSEFMEQIGLFVVVFG